MDARCLFLTLALFPAWTVSADAQTAAADSAGAADSTAVAGTAVALESKPAGVPLSQRIYYGGSFTFSIGSTTRIGIFPCVGYKITPRTSGGIGLSYEYINYEGRGRSGHNYGVSTFARYRLVPKIYGHAEFRVSDYEVFTAPDSHRATVPFLLLGGGYANQISARTWAYVEMLFDVINDPDSPYGEGEPMINVGASVGF